jgi:hypothetical protein
MTCAEYKESVNAQVLEKFKLENNIKDCPHCNTSIEKIAGCNHVECTGCHTHICWVCMEAFDASGHCYAHMTEAHGGNGLHDDYLSDEDD